MSNITDDFVYQLPNGTQTIEDVLFNLPSQYTNGLFINFWLMGLFGVLFLGSLTFDISGKKASLFASFGTFITAFLFTLGGWAGGNQLIPATIIFLGAIVVNYMDTGGGF